MLYVFENGSVVYDGDTLTEKEKAKAVVIDKLPEPDKIEGKVPALRANKRENRVYYEYLDKPQEPELEQMKDVVNALGQELASLKIQVIMGGM